MAQSDGKNWFGAGYFATGYWHTNWWAGEAIGAIISRSAKIIGSSFRKIIGG